jgi:uncharacterized membrane protein
LSRSNTIVRHRRFSAVLAYLLAALLGAVGQLCFKIVAGGDLSSIAALASCPHLWIAALSYVGVMGLFIFGLRCWGEISVLYPVYGATFVFALIFSSVWLDERLDSMAIAGTVLIVLGIALLSQNKELS